MFCQKFDCNLLSFYPGEREAEDLRDFKLTSLVGGLYKWLAKVLANRLKLVVGKVISKTQNAFMEEDKYWMQPLLPMKP